MNREISTDTVLMDRRRERKANDWLKEVTVPFSWALQTASMQQTVDTMLNRTDLQCSFAYTVMLLLQSFYLKISCLTVHVLDIVVFGLFCWGSKGFLISSKIIDLVAQTISDENKT